MTSRLFVDASGHVGFLRRSLGVEVEEPTSLKNIAIWNYWTKPAWEDVEGVGKGGARVRVMSLGYGWIWFIPISKDRTSVGLVTHAEYFKQSGMRPAELYAKALAEELHVADLLEGAAAEPEVKRTKDWSFLSQRMVGENWFLVGECAGFADPILAGGMTLAMVGAREAAYAMLSILQGEHDEAWLKDWYETTQRRRIGQHIRFADYWYSANEHFSDLKEYTTKIAADAGLDLNPDEAFRWLAAGGFANDDLTSPIAGTYRLGAAKLAMQVMTGQEAGWDLNRFNVFKLNVEGAEVVKVPYCSEGRIEAVKCFQREGKLLPLIGMFRLVYRGLCNESDAKNLLQGMHAMLAKTPGIVDPRLAMHSVLDALEGMLAEGWITASVNPDRPFLKVALDEATISMAGRA